MNEAYRRLAEDGSIDLALYQTDPVYHALVYRVRHGSYVKGEGVDVHRIRQAHVYAMDGDLAVCEACGQDWYREGRQEGCDAVHLIAAYHDRVNRLAGHLEDAIHDLIEDWEETGGPRMRYEEARSLLRALGR